MEKYFDISKDGQSIRCKLYYNEHAPIEKVILFGHGFAGHRDSGSSQKFADRVLSGYKRIAVLTYALPGHGEDAKRKIVLRDCMTYLETVTGYIKTELHTDQIYSYATSFGGYLVLKYIAEHDDPFIRIALRCPAVNMADVLTGTIMKPDELDEVLKGKNVPVGFDRKTVVNRQFLTDLQASDIQKYAFRDHADDILILHGTGDEVVPFDTVRRFAENNGIRFIPVENADHRFLTPGAMENATREVLEFFGF